MAPKPIRAPTRKAAAATSPVPALLDAAHLFAGSNPQLAAVLGRRALELADEQPSSLPRGAAHGLCARCGVPFVKEVLQSGEPMKLPHHLVRRKRRRESVAAAKGAQAQQANRAAVIYTCQLCDHRTAQPFYNLHAAREVVRRSGGQQAPAAVQHAGSVPQQCTQHTSGMLQQLRGITSQSQAAPTPPPVSAEASKLETAPGSASAALPAQEPMLNAGAAQGTTAPEQPTAPKQDREDKEGQQGARLELQLVHASAAPGAQAEAESQQHAVPVTVLEEEACDRPALQQQVGQQASAAAEAEAAEAEGQQDQASASAAEEAADAAVLVAVVAETAVETRGVTLAAAGGGTPSMEAEATAQEPLETSGQLGSEAAGGAAPTAAAEQESDAALEETLADVTTPAEPLPAAAAAAVGAAAAPSAAEEQGFAPAPIAAARADAVETADEHFRFDFQLAAGQGRQAAEETPPPAEEPAPEVDSDGDLMVARRGWKRPLAPGVEAASSSGEGRGPGRPVKRARRISWDPSLERVREFDREPHPTDAHLDRAVQLLGAAANAAARGERLRFKTWQRVGRAWKVFVPR